MHLLSFYNVTNKGTLILMRKFTLKRINEARINAHMTLRHNKNWINYYLVLKK